MNHLTLHIAQLSIDSQRKMQGVAYSGGALSYYDEHIAIDLATLQLNSKQVPLLHNHDRERVVGYGYLSLSEDPEPEMRKLLVHGSLLSNDAAKQIADAADEGLQWQLSVHVESGTVERLEAGQVVNGKVLLQATRVFKNAMIREVSFTPTGVDANTQAVLLSLHTEPQSQPKEPTMNQELETLKNENQALKAQLQAVQKAQRQAQLSDLGLSEEEQSALLSFDETSFSTTLSLLKKQHDKQKQQEVLDEHQSALLSSSFATPSKAGERPNPLLACLSPS